MEHYLDRGINKRLRTGIFFIIIFALLFFLGRARLPLALPFWGWVLWRDAGTMFHYLVSGPGPVTGIIRGILGHVEGPLQFIILNAYCYGVGDIFPLNPATMQFPNTILTFLIAVFAFLLGRRLFSDRFAYCLVVAFALSPWLAFTLRVPWYFNTLSCLLHFTTFYFFTGFMMQPGSKFYRVAAPVSFSFYIWTGLDWPMYFLVLAFFLWRSGAWRSVLWNPFNILPLTAITFLIIWAAALYLKLGTGAFMFSRPIYPFLRLVEQIQACNWISVWEYTLLPSGAHLISAIIGLAGYFYGDRKVPNPSSVARAFLDSMGLWFILATPLLIVSSGDPTYLYVIGMPSAVFAAFTLAKLRWIPLAITIFTMLCLQLLFIFGPDFISPPDQKRRVLAAACYLIEQRPDLLKENKKHMATGDPSIIGNGEHGAAVSQYARSRTKCLIVPLDWPVLRDPSDLDDVKSFVDNYTEKGVINADWLIVESEALSETNIARDFFLQLLHDPNVRWLARFRESTGQVIYIGEVMESGAVPIEEVPEMDVMALSNQYESNYDRISFLKNHVPYIWKPRLQETLAGAK